MTVMLSNLLTLQTSLVVGSTGVGVVVVVGLGATVVVVVGRGGVGCGPFLRPEKNSKFSHFIVSYFNQETRQPFVMAVGLALP